MKRPRRNHGATSKAQVALTIVKGDKTVVESAEQFSVHPPRFTELEAAAAGPSGGVFSGTKPPSETPDLKYLPIQRGFIHLCAILDRVSRRAQAGQRLRRAAGLWRSLTYEEIYLHAYETVGDAYQGVVHDLTFYNQIRPHHGLDGRPPDRVYLERNPGRTTAA